MRLEIFGMGIFLLVSGCTSVYQQQYELHSRIRDWEGAGRVLEKAMIDDPDNPEIYYLLGQAYGYRGKYEEMDEALQRSLSLSGRYSAEIDRLRDYFVVEQLNRGIERYNRQEFESSINELLRVGAIKRDENRHYRYLGFCYSKIGEFEEAARNLKLSSDLTGDLDSKIELVHVYDILGRSRGVIEVAEEILSDRPERLDLLVLLAAAYGSAGDLEDSIHTYERILELSPSNAAAMYNLALLLCREDRKNEAVPLLGQLSVMEPDSPEIHYAACSILYEAGRYEESLTCFQGYLERDPLNIEALKHLFVLNRMLDRWDDAERIKQRLEMLEEVSVEMESGHENSLEVP